MRRSRASAALAGDFTFSRFPRPRTRPKSSAIAYFNDQQSVVSKAFSLMSEHADKLERVSRIKDYMLREPQS